MDCSFNGKKKHTLTCYIHRVQIKRTRNRFYYLLKVSDIKKLLFSCHDLVPFVTSSRNTNHFNLDSNFQKLIDWPINNYSAQNIAVPGCVFTRTILTK